MTTPDFERFARAMFELSGWPDGDGIDGCSFQDAAIECGLLRPETRYAPCDPDVCHCAEYYGDMSEGVTCYRKRSEQFSLPAALDRRRVAKK